MTVRFQRAINFVGLLFGFQWNNWVIQLIFRMVSLQFTPFVGLHFGFQWNNWVIQLIFSHGLIAVHTFLAEP
jgi:hypothetical protein